MRATFCKIIVRKALARGHRSQARSDKGEGGEERGFYQEAAPPPPPPASSSSSNPDASLNIVIATKVSSLFREPCSALHQNRNSCLPLAEKRSRYYEAFKGEGCSVHTRRQTGQVTNIPVPLSAAGRAFMMGKSRPRSDEKPSTDRCGAKPRWLERPLTGPLCL